MNNKRALDNKPTSLLNLRILCPQGQIIDKKLQEISHSDFFSAVIKLFQELVIGNMGDKFGKNT